MQVNGKIWNENCWENLSLFTMWNSFAIFWWHFSETPLWRLLPNNLAESLELHFNNGKKSYKKTSSFKIALKKNELSSNFWGAWKNDFIVIYCFVKVGKRSWFGSRSSFGFWQRSPSHLVLGAKVVLSVIWIMILTCCRGSLEIKVFLLFRKAEVESSSENVKMW